MSRRLLRQSVLLLLIPGAPVRAEGGKERLIGLAAGAALGGAFAAAGEGPFPRLEEPGALDAAVIVAGVGVAAATRFSGKCEGPACCRWCDARDGQDRLNGLDRSIARALVWKDRNRADRWSDATLSAAFAQSVTYVVAGNRPAAGRDAVVLLESFAVSTAITQVAKSLARRPRPYTHKGDAPPGERLDSPDARLSFFSGHASTSFCFAVAAGTIAFAREDKNAGWVLGTGLALAATTSYLRIAADRHYFTDVLVGAVVGSAAGFLVPHLHRPEAGQATAAIRLPGRGGASFTLPVTVKGARAAALTASFSGGKALTLRVAW